MSISDSEPARADFGRRILPRNISVSTRITQHDSSFGNCASKAVQTARTPINSGIERYPRREIHRLFHTSVKNLGGFPQPIHPSGELHRHGWEINRRLADRR